MTTKKRFYIKDDEDGYPELVDLHHNPNQEYIVCAEPYRKNGIDLRYLQELCDLLNRGHEAVEIDANRQKLYESCLKIESGEIKPKESKPYGPARTWGHENIQAGKRFYRLNNFNGWWDRILILDSEVDDPERHPVSDFYVGLSKEHTDKTSAYADELLERLNEATDGLQDASDETLIGELRRRIEQANKAELDNWIYVTYDIHSDAVLTEPEATEAER